MQVTTNRHTPNGLIFAETAQSGRIKVWAANNLIDACVVADRATIRSGGFDGTTLAELTEFLGRDLRNLTVYTLTDAADLAEWDGETALQNAASSLGWIEEGASLYAQNAAEFGTVNLPDGTELALSQQAYADTHGSGEVRYYAEAQDAEGNLFRVEWATTEAWDEREAAYKADPDSNAAGEDESDACDWAAPLRIIAL